MKQENKSLPSKEATKKRKQQIKYLVIIAAVILIATGTFPGTKKSFWPIYQVKDGKSFGINVCVVTLYSGTQEKQAIHNGLDLSLFTIQGGYSQINGVGISCMRVSDGKTKEKTFNGLEASLLNFHNGNAPHKIDKEVNGVQIGIVYNCSQGKCFQIGLYNELVNSGGNIQGAIGFNSNLIDYE